MLFLSRLFGLFLGLQRLALLLQVGEGVLDEIGGWLLSLLHYLKTNYLLMYSYVYYY